MSWLRHFSQGKRPLMEPIWVTSVRITCDVTGASRPTALDWRVARCLRVLQTADLNKNHMCR